MSAQFVDWAVGGGEVQCCKNKSLSAFRKESQVLQDSLPHFDTKPNAMTSEKKAIKNASVEHQQIAL
jgi:hypothetical protein